ASERSHPCAGWRHATRRGTGRRVGDRLTRFALAGESVMQFSQRLNDMEARFDAVTRQMADPAVIADGEAYRKIAKTRSELEETISKYRDYKQAKRNYDEARSMVEEPDPELRQMAHDEIARLEPEMARIEEEM